MKALTVRQPWAWQIIHQRKDIENRSRNIAGAYRGPVAIHAGLKADEDALARLPMRPPTFVTAPRLFDYGVILGTVELVDVHHDAGCCGPWGEHGEVETARSRTNRSRYGTRDTAHRTITHLVLANPRPLAEPIPCKGALGLWTPPVDVVARIEAEARHA